MLSQKQRKAGARPAIDPAEAARLEREAIRAWLETRPGEDWDKDANKRPAAELAAEAETRKAAGPGRMPAAEAVRKVPNPVAAWQEIQRAEVSRLELADFAREAARLEREAKRRRPDRFTVAAVKRSAAVLLADMPAAEVAAKSGLKRAADDYRIMSEVAAESGTEVSELAEALETEKLLAAEQSRPLADMQTEFGYSEPSHTAAYWAARKEYTRELLNWSGPAAGREVLDYIGPRASAVVVTSLADNARVTVAHVRTVPDVAIAEARAAKLAGPLAEAREALERAEAKLATVKKTGNAQARKVAESAAAAKLAGVTKLAAKFAAAEAAAEAARELAALPSAEKLVSVPLESFRVSTQLAADVLAAKLDIPDRADRMPSAFMERGPRVRSSASWSGETQHGGRGSGVSDPTGDSAAALVDGYRAAVARAEAAEVKLAASVTRAKCEAAREVAKENTRTAYKAREAARLREYRRTHKTKR